MKKIVHLLLLQGWKSSQRWCPPVPGQAKLLLDRAIPHAACPSSSSCITTTLSYFSLNKRESQRECLWKAISTCSAPWLSIDSAMCRRKESRLSPSSCRTLQCDQNSDTPQCNRTWIEWGSDPAKLLSIWRPQPKQNGAEICIWSIATLVGTRYTVFDWQRSNLTKNQDHMQRVAVGLGRRRERGAETVLSEENSLSFREKKKTRAQV